MRNRLRVTLLLVAFVTASRPAHAWDVATDLWVYDTEGGYMMGGYTGTWKGWEDESYGYDCAYYDYDPEWDYWYCAADLYWENWAGIVGRLFGPPGLVAAGSWADFWAAELDLVDFEPQEGEWAHVGDHYVVQDLYQNSGYGWEYIGTNNQYLGRTQANRTVQPRQRQPCVPSLIYPFREPLGYFSGVLGQAGMGDIDTRGRDAWNNFLGKTGFFQKTGRPGVQVLTFQQMSDWGAYQPGPDTIWISAQVWNDGQWDTITHEFGHARGYAHISANLSVCQPQDSIMWPDEMSNGYGFGPGDVTAAQRDHN